MTRRTYEIHLRGHLPPEVAEDLDVTNCIDAPAETVLLTGRIDQAGVHELIDRLRDFGIELLELRRCADDHVASEEEPDD
jgi:hypothetical protein